MKTKKQKNSVKEVAIKFEIFNNDKFKITFSESIIGLTTGDILGLLDGARFKILKLAYEGDEAFTQEDNKNE